METTKRKRKNQPKRYGSTDIAIIGMACRVPGADDAQEFWNNLTGQVNSIREMPASRWDPEQYYSPDIKAVNKSVSKWVGLLDNADLFDNRFFNISPREANQMDPQQRLLLEETWHCIEDAGVPLSALQAKRTSLYMGLMNNDYREEATADGVEMDTYSAIGNFEAFIANRLSYFFNFTGASQPINVACASSLTAVHEAKRALRTGDCDYAIAGGVSLNLHPWKYISFSKLRMLSPDGQCKTFDKDANGYVPGDGVGVLLLQRVEDAIRDGNHIYGIVKGSSVNHGGRALSITAPNLEVQKKVFLEAYRDAGMSPATINYVEAQGTGTSLGDPIEIEALTRAFREYTQERQYCKIASAKPNIGHLEAASGVVAIIKVLMMMRHRKIPKLLNLKTLNPILDFANTPFVVATEQSDWERMKPGAPLRAGINSFGFGGANAHLLLEEYVAEAGASDAAGEEEPQLFALSAKSSASLTKLLEEWCAFAKSESYAELSLRDISATLLTGRESFAYRYGLRVGSRDELAAILEEAGADAIRKTEPKARALHVGNLPWQGYGDASRLMKGAEPVRKQVEALLAQLAKIDKGRDVQKSFQETIWAEKDRPLYSFILGYAYVVALQEAGIRASAVRVGKEGVWIGLAASGIVSPEMVLAVLSGKKKAEQLEFSRPSVPFHDPVSQEVILPYRFDGAYVQELLTGLEVAAADEAAFGQYVDKARLLNESQFTFKKFVEEWSGSVKQAIGRDVEELLAEGMEASPRDKQLLLLSVVSSLQKLNAKWSITERELLEAPRFYELIHLLVDEAAPMEALVELLTSDAGDGAAFAEVLNERQSRVNLEHPYELLRARNAQLRDIAHPAEWLEQAVSAAAVENGDDLDLGSVDGFQETLLRLWLEGAAVEWKTLNAEGSFKRAALPGYRFERQAFRLNKKESTGEKGMGEKGMAGKKQTEGAAIRFVQTELVDILSKLMGVPTSELDLQADLREYGLDSIVFTEFADGINERFGTGMNPTAFFQYPTLEALAGYLAATADVAAEVPETEAQTTEEPVLKQEAAPAPVQKKAPAPAKIEKPRAAVREGRKDVAIIGMSGRFPRSRNTREFWENLAADRDLITEIPEDRWNWGAVFGDPHGADNKTRSKWGGYLDDIKGFDANFFKISPKEAELMDPQQRIMLEEVWHAIEDAGYKASSLSGTQTGVFFGVFNDDYNELLIRNDVKLDAYTSTGTYFSIIPNRISFQLNLHGPSLAIETACSGSLVAIHQAVQAIQNDDCTMAFAGGVNINSTPRRHISFDNAGMLAQDGRCKTFDASANGYVRGEGAGVIFLKDLEQALADGDYIYGVIKGSAVNHGGAANSLTAPNPNAQADLIVTAMERAGFAADTVSYIEAHGTGTPLGDPIEINGLKMAFDELAKRSGKDPVNTGYCAIGSAKTSIGHLESAAGIAGVIKVLLSMKHGHLPGNIQLKEINPYVQVEGTPFSLVQEAKAWERLLDENGQEIPRRAGISSFGFGGANAHVVIEEFVNPVGAADQGPKAVVLSAKNEERLKATAKELAEFLTGAGAEGLSLTDIAYTLQMGREEMEERLAFVAATVEELAEKLHAFANGKSDGSVSKGNLKESKKTSGLLLDGEEGEEYVRIVIGKRKLDKIAQLWVMGVKIDWNLLYEGEEPRRIPLPGYAFEKRSFWFDSYKTKAAPAPAAAPVAAAPKAHAAVAVASAAPKAVSAFPPLDMSKQYHGDEVQLRIVDEHIAIVVMQDKENRNMFSSKIIQGLTAKFAEIKRNENIKAVIVTGYDNVFCMGGTQEELESISERKINFTELAFMYRGMLECDIPVISAIQGHAMGGGLTYGLYADFVVMAEECVYSSNFMKYGFTPGMGTTFILKEKLGNTLATEMMFTAKLFPGEELKNRGASLLFKKQKDVLNEALALAKMLVEKPRYALQVLKQELSARVMAELPVIIDSELEMHDKTFSNPEVMKRIKAHFNKTETASAAPAPKPNKPQALAAPAPAPAPVVQAAKIKLSKPTAAPAPAAVPQNAGPSVEQVRDRIAGVVGEILHLTREELDEELSFKDLGVDSISGVEVVRDLNKAFALHLEAGVIYDFANINTLAVHIQEQLQGTVMAAASEAAVTAEVVKPGKIALKSLTQEKIAPATAAAISQPTATSASTASTAQATAQATASAQTTTASVPAASNAPSEDSVRERVASIVGEILHLTRGELDLDLSFKDLGVDSISGVEVVRDLNKAFALNLEAGVIYDFASIASLSVHVHEQLLASGQAYEAAPAPQATTPAVQAAPAPAPSVPAAPAAPAPAPQAAAQPSKQAAPDTDSVREQIAAVVGNVLHLTRDEIDLDASFKDLGVDSISGVEVVRDLNKAFAVNLEAGVIYDFSSINALTAYIAGQVTVQEDEDEQILALLKRLQSEDADLDEVDQFLEDIL